MTDLKNTDKEEIKDLITEVLSETTHEVVFHRGDEKDLVNNDRVYSNGKPVYSKTLKKLKIGDGVTHYTDLPFYMEDELKAMNAKIEALEDRITELEKGEK